MFLGIGASLMGRVCQLKRAAKLANQLNSYTTKELIHWYKVKYFPELKRMRPDAVVFAGANVAEVGHFAHSVVDISPLGMISSVTLFALSKFIYCF